MTKQFPRVLMVVWNAIESDSRVQKEALSLSLAGCDVTLIGVSFAAKRQRGMLGSVKVEIFSVGNAHKDARSNKQKSLKSRLISVLKKWPGVAARGRVRSMKVYSRQIAKLISAEIDIEDVDVVHIQDYKALEIGIRLQEGKEKLVYDAHEYLPGVIQEAHLKKYFEKLERLATARSDAVITVSPAIATRIRDEQNPPCDITVIRNTPQVDSNPGPRNVRTDSGLDDSARLIVYSGSIAPQRGVPTLLDAMLEVEKAHLAVVAPSQNSLDIYLNAKKYAPLVGRLHVVPFVAPGQVSHYLSTADLAVHPMPSRMSGRIVLNHQYALPNKWFEYVRAGLPVVVSDVKVLSGLVKSSGIGEVFNSNDSKSLADALTKVLLDVESYRSKVTQQMKADADWQIDRARLVKVYAELFPQWKPSDSASQDVPELHLFELI